MIHPVLYNLDFGGRIRELSSILRVNSFTNAAIGGPKTASISVRGSESAIWEAANWLRYPVELFSDQGHVLWWGFVSKVKIRHRGTEVMISLGSMANRVSAKYTYVPSGMGTSRSGETTWYQSAESIAAFGTREKKFTFSNTSEEAAIQRLARLLEELQYPYPVQGSSDSEESLSAHLECRGWWNTLLWKYYTQLAGEESYVETGVGVQHIGTTASQKVTQFFQRQSSDPWKADALFVRVRKAGSPADQLRVRLVDNAYNSLATALIDPSVLTNSYQWIRCDISPTYDLAAGVTYGVLLERTGSNDNTNHYSTDVVEPPGYAPGVLRIWNGSSWVARGTDADMPFRVTGVQETSEQLKELVLDAGQFFTGVDVVTSSGVFSNPYRNGDQVGHAYAAELIDTATQNNRRLLATVTRERRVRIYEEPDPAQPQYFLDAHQKMHTIINEPIPAILTPHAVWAQMYEVIPETVVTSRLADASRMFVEEVEYDTLTDTARLSLRGARTLQDLGEVEQG